MNELSTVYSYGGGEVLFQIFNAIAMLFNGGFVKSIFEFITALALIWSGFKSMSIKDAPHIYTKLFASTVLVWLLIIQPIGSGVTLHIRDVVTKRPIQPVNNLPPALVIPASVISGLGYNLTKSFEMVFSSPSGAMNYLEYHKYGTMFGAQVISELRNFKIQNPVFRENMENYISSCMMYDVMIGKKYDIHELKTSNDVLKLITDNASTLRMVNYRNSTHQGRELIKCKQAITRITQSFNDEPDLLSKKFRIFSKNHTGAVSNQALGSGITKALELSTKFYGNMGTESAQDKLKQILIINAFKDKPDSYGVIRSAQNQNTGWSLAGEMAKQNLPILHAIFEAIIYAMFPLVICMLFFPGGLSAIGKYFGILIWIQLWPPLFAVINLMVSIFAKLSGTTDALTIQNIEDIVSAQSNYAMAASSLGMLVPFLSWIIMRCGAGQFVHLAGQITGSTSVGVSSATQELTSGNRSFDNINIGDKSLHNIRANKYDTSASLELGFMRHRLTTGEYQTDLASGDMVLQGGAGITKSVGGVDFRSHISNGSSYRDLAEQHRSISSTTAQEYADTQQHMERKGINFIARMAEHQARGEMHELSDGTHDNQTLQHYINKTKDLQDRYSYEWNQAAEKAISLGGNIRGYVDKSSHKDGELLGIVGTVLDKASGIKGGLSGSLEVGANTRGSFGNSDTQGLSEINATTSRDDYAQNIESIARASKSVTFNDNQSKEKALADELSQLHEKSIQQRESIAEHDTKAAQAQQTYEKIQSFSQNIGRDEYHGLLNYISKKNDSQFKGHQIGQRQAHRIIENDPVLTMQYYRQYKESQRIHAMQMGYDPDTLGKIQNLENKGGELNIDNIDMVPGQVKSKFKDLNNTGDFKEQMKNEQFREFNSEGEDIKNKYHTRKDSADGKIADQKMIINKESERIKKEVNTAEDDKGFVAQLFGAGRKNPNRGNSE